MSEKYSALVEARDQVKRILDATTDPMTHRYLSVSLWSLNKAVHIQEKVKNIAAMARRGAKDR